MRTETDTLGSMAVPADVYWGIHTASGGQVPSDRVHNLTGNCS